MYLSLNCLPFLSRCTSVRAALVGLFIAVEYRAWKRKVKVLVASDSLQLCGL